MRTLDIHAADELVTRWKRRAFELDLSAERRPTDRIGRLLRDLDREKAQGMRVCAAELAAVVAVTMELEAAHHGDPEPDERTGARRRPERLDGSGREMRVGGLVLPPGGKRAAHRPAAFRTTRPSASRTTLR